jgi:hypothetical protein
MQENRLDEISKMCADKRLPLRVQLYDRQNPGSCAYSVLAAIAQCTGRVFIDVSGMSRLLIAQLVTGVRAKGLSGVSILYVEAEEYFPVESAVEKCLKERQTDPTHAVIFLSQGVFDVSVLPELSSISLLGQPIRLVAFPSFNPDQLTAIRSEVQPSRYSIIHGLTPSSQLKWRTDAIRKLNCTDEIPNREERNVSTLDYRETVKCLLEIYQKFGANERIVVSPTGSKMQAVAVGLVRGALEDLQVVYPTPSSFKTGEYTRGAKTLFRLDLDVFACAR